MKLVIRKIPDVGALYFRQLRQIFSAEEMIVRALPTMMEKATDTQLKQAFESQKKDAEVHLKRLQAILSRIAGEAEELTSKSMRALIDEGDEVVKDSTHDGVRDAALISSGARIQHDQIAAYGSALHCARVLGLEPDTVALQAALHEEQHGAHLLETIAERVHPAARKAA